MKIKGLLADLEREREVQAPLPLHVVLLIDCSGSIKEHLEAIKRAASGLAEQVREKGKVGVVSFGGEGVQIKSKLTDNERALRKACHLLPARGELKAQEILADLSRKEYLPLASQNPLFREPVEFPLYTREEGKEGYALFLPEGQCLQEEEQRKLAERGVQTLFIRGKDRRRYEQGLGRGIDRILTDRSLTLEKKGEILYENASHALRETFQDSGEKLEVERLGDSSRQVLKFISFMLSERHNFRGLGGCLSHDSSLWTHSANACAYGLALASFLGWDHFDTLYALGLGLLLHDLGKRRLPWRIMKKPDPIGLKEWVITKKHPLWGARALRESLAVVPVGVYLPIEQHHEQLDGSGYPQGLKGKEIHPFGRIAAIADLYDILTSDRPGHSALPSIEALRWMADEMCEQLDPELLHAFILCLGVEGPEGER